MSTSKRRTELDRYDVAIGETTDDGELSLIGARCIGACGLAPVMIVGEDTLGNIEPKDTVPLLDGYQ